MNGIFELVADVFGFVFVGLPAMVGYFLIYVGMRFRKSAIEADEAGLNLDPSSFWLNWFKLIWSLAERAKQLTENIPGFGQDLSEQFGVKKDDGVARK